LTPTLFDSAELRRRLSRPDPEAGAVEADLLPYVAPDRLVPAAVLVGITAGPVSGVLLTKRTAHLRQHSGQVSFPGGRIDPGDASPEAAALREANEEVGIDPGHVEVVGRLRDHVTTTGYRVTPVLALLRPGFVTAASADEVEAVFQLPLAVLLDPAGPRRRTVMVGGMSRAFWVWPHPEHEIWGATAAMLVQLAARLRADEAAID
jgi:8-oxo-dGTP pyrophosphatase MutT (NUDIX family)